MGKKFGKQMKAVAAAVENFDQESIALLEKQGHFPLLLNGEELMIEAADVEIINEDIPGWLVANEGNITVALDVTVTEELRREGIARELVNRIQNVRKNSGLEITDKIHVLLSNHPQINAAVEEFSEYICAQVQAATLKLADNVTEGTELELEDLKLYVKVEKA